MWLLDKELLLKSFLKKLASLIIFLFVLEEVDLFLDVLSQQKSYLHYAKFSELSLKLVMMLNSLLKKVKLSQLKLLKQ